MYNTDFLPQLEKSRKYIFGKRTTEPREASDKAHIIYSVPKGATILECVEDSNGEFVPKKSLERKVNSK